MNREERDKEEEEEGRRGVTRKGERELIKEREVGNEGEVRKYD